MKSAPLLLLVDDEAVILELLSDALVEGGYTLLTAIRASEAIAIIEQRAADLAGLITDINLDAETTGWEVARRARELRPDLPVVYTTANAAADWPVEGVPKSVLVPKPFAPAQVVTAISTLITKAASETKPPE